MNPIDVALVCFGSILAAIVVALVIAAAIHDARHPSKITHHCRVKFRGKTIFEGDW
jgi:hypothetical protein